MEIAVILLLFLNDNQEFFDKQAQLRAEGYKWRYIECREPLPGQVEGKDYISLNRTDTHPGYVCNELKK